MVCLFSISYGLARQLHQTVQKKSSSMQTRLTITQPNSLPLREGFGTVDSVACLSQLDRCDSPQVLIEEIARVMRPGGLLLLSVPEGGRGGVANRRPFTKTNFESILSAWFTVELQQSMETEDQKLLICKRKT